MATIEKSQEIKKMEIKYLFTEEELKDIAEETAKRVLERDSLEDEKKDVTRTYNTQIKNANTDISRLSHEYRQGWKLKLHECYEIFDYEQKLVHICRADTDAIVGNRVMTTDEFQREAWSPLVEINALPEKIEIVEDPEGEIVEVNFQEVQDDDTDQGLLDDEEIPEAEGA